MKIKKIFITGSPDVDIILDKKLPKLSHVKKRYDINFDNYAIAILHPVVTNTKFLKNEANCFTIV